MDHGNIAQTIDHGVETSRARLDELAELGIDLDAITKKLQDEGVAAFAKSFNGLLKSIAEKRQQLLGDWKELSTSVGS